MHDRKVARIALFIARWPKAASRVSRACLMHAWHVPSASSVSHQACASRGSAGPPCNELRYSCHPSNKLIDAHCKTSSATYA